MQRRCFSYSKSVRPSVGADVTLRYCVKTVQAYNVTKSSLFVYRKYSRSRENRFSIFQSSIFSASVYRSPQSNRRRTEQIHSILTCRDVVQLVVRLVVYDKLK